MIGALNRLVEWRLRGIRVINIFAVACLAVMVFSTYVAKAGAARESQEIGDLERAIADQGERVRLLRAEAARLENPARLEALSREAGLLPPDIDRIAQADDLATLSPLPEPAPPAPVSTVPVAEDEAAPPPVEPDMIDEGAQ